MGISPMLPDETSAVVFGACCTSTCTPPAHHLHTTCTHDTWKGACTRTAHGTHAHADARCVRRQAIAPNLTTVVGELVGARLIAHAGSLMNLAKQPASTVQILGAEKVRTAPPLPTATSAQPACWRPRPRSATSTPRRPTPPPRRPDTLRTPPGDDETYAKIFSPTHPDETPAVVFGARPLPACAPSLSRACLSPRPGSRGRESLSPPEPSATSLRHSA